MRKLIIRLRKRYEKPIPHSHKGIPCKAKFSWLGSNGKWKGNTYDPDYKYGFCVEVKK